MEAGNPGKKGKVSLQEMGKERPGKSGITKVVENERVTNGPGTWCYTRNISVELAAQCNITRHGSRKKM